MDVHRMNHRILFDLILLISEHSRAIMQVLDTDINKLYITRMDDTKCLNTCVMLIYVLTGYKSLHLIQNCDVEHTQERNRHTNHDKIVLRELRDCLSTKPKPVESKLIYVLLSDGYYKRGGLGKYFPGHVFIIEMCGDNTHYIYQSYVKKYTLKDALDNDTGFNPISTKKLNTYLNLFGKIMKPGFIWKKNHVKTWNDLTHVCVDELVGYTNDQSDVHMCFKEFVVDNEQIHKHTEKFITRTLRKIRYHQIRGNDDVYKPTTDVVSLRDGKYYSPEALAKIFQEFRIGRNLLNKKRGL